MQNAARRVSTVRDISVAIVSQQKLFLDYGALAMNPLGLREVADAVGVVPPSRLARAHPTPHRVFRTAVLLLPEARPMQAPATSERNPSLWSDALAPELCQQGFGIARRTVTKYRQGLNIDPVQRGAVPADASGKQSPPAWLAGWLSSLSSSTSGRPAPTA